MTTLSEHAYRRDFAGRMPVTLGPLTVRLAGHLEGQESLALAEPVLSALRDGQDLAKRGCAMVG